MEQNREERKRLAIYSQLIFNKDEMTIQWRQSFKQMVLEQFDFY